VAILSDEDRARFVEEARSFIGVPWKHLGRARSGIDCIGLLLVAGERSGVIPKFEFTAYSRLPNGAGLLTEFDKYCNQKPLTEIRRGDILVTRDTSVLLPCHCGVIDERFGEFRLIHAYAKARRVVESRLEDFRHLAIRLYEIK
jgi:cell wall-associated NlpC family hydrolase